MKKIMTSLAVLALVVVSLQAGPKVELKYSGPGNQGNLIWWAPSSGITNLVMGTNGVTYLYIEGGAILNSTAITNVLASGMVLPAVDGSAVTNMSAAQLKAGTVLLAVSGAAITNVPAAALVGGFSGVITNTSTVSTSTVWYYRGMVTNATSNP